VINDRGKSLYTSINILEFPLTLAQPLLREYFAKRLSILVCEYSIGALPENILQAPLIQCMC